MLSRAQLLALASLPFLALPAHAQTNIPLERMNDGGLPWNYDEERGNMDQWGDLSEENAKCLLGMEQSPVHITFTDIVRLAPLKLDYKLSPVTLLQRNHALEMDVKPGNTLTLLKDVYTLKTIVLHTPSEHVIKDEFYIGEAQLVHENKEGKKLILAVLLGGDSEQLQYGLDRILMAVPDALFQFREQGGISMMPTAPEDSAPPMKSPPRKQPRVKAIKFNFDPSSLLPKKLGYYVYKGSLTIPPCTEDVQWHVLKEPVRITNVQAQMLVKAMGRNSRAKQPIYSRTIYESADE